jgi:hypothetical protein
LGIWFLGALVVWAFALDFVSFLGLCLLGLWLCLRQSQRNFVALPLGEATKTKSKSKAKRPKKLTTRPTQRTRQPPKTGKAKLVGRAIGWVPVLS